MIATDPLVAFVRARIEEEERDARAAHVEPWQVTFDYKQEEGTTAWKVAGSRLSDVIVERKCDAVTAPRARNVTHHIARQDPAATLARCEALTALVASHSPERLAPHTQSTWLVCSRCMAPREEQEDWPCDVVKGVAAIWRIGPDGTQHPEWREGWEL